MKWEVYTLSHFRGEGCVCIKLLQSCLTLCDLMDYSPPGSSVHGILQVRILEWIAMPSFRGSPIPGIVHMILHLLHWQVGSLSLATWEAQLLNNHQQKVWNLPKKIFYFQRQRSHNKTAEEEHS